MGIFQDILTQLKSDPARDLGQPMSREEIIIALRTDSAEPTAPSPFAEFAASIMKEQTFSDQDDH